jgi:tetratricopeptide (TPR) repeat protein
MKRLAVTLAALALSACTASTPTVQQSPDEIPFTTTSPEARQHFAKGLVFFENVRTSEARAEFEAALKLDPNFVSARAMLGSTIFGPDGLRDLEQANSQAAKLPDAERAFIAAAYNSRRGDSAGAATEARKLTELRPADPRSHFTLGQSLMFGSEDYAGGSAALQKAIELQPNHGPALNSLGYAQLRQGNAEGAITALQKYVAVDPQEPNAQDSLGEALLAAGRYAEAEAAFRKALDLSPRYYNGWEGIAYCKFYAGDYAGGREAIAKAVETAEQPLEKIGSQTILVMAALAARKPDDAMKAIDDAEKTPGAQAADLARMPLLRAMVLADGGKTKEGLAEIDKALRTSANGTLPAPLARNLKRNVLVTRVLVEARMKDVAAAQKTAAILKDDSAARPEDKGLASSMHFAMGMAAGAEGNAEAARTHFASCSKFDGLCQAQLAGGATKPAVQRASAAADAPAATPGILLRDPLFLYARSRK